MGMAASQGRFLQLTSRKNDIGLQLTRLSNEKVSLSREMQNVSRRYQDALNTKTLKWSNNAGVSYIDLSYSNLMTPSAMNQQQPYVLTDSAGKVVIASNYSKYAEMISPDGAAGGDWKNNRTKILAELTGIDEGKLNSYDSAKANLDAAQANLDGLNDYKETKIDPLMKKFEGKGGTAALVEKLGSTTGGGSFASKGNWKDAYNSGDSIKISGTSELQGIANQLKNLAAYFPDIETADFEKGIDNSIKGSMTAMANGTELPTGGTVTGSKDKGFEVNVVALINSALSAAGATKAPDNAYAGSSKVNYEWYDTSKPEYATWKTEHDAWHEKYEAGMAQYNTAESALASIFTSAEESEFAFYDAIFTAIAEKGWTQNNKVTDTSYLNEMLQNGIYSLTTMTKSLYVDGQNTDGSARFNYEYSTDIAVNNNHVYTVNDSDVQNDAMVDYEYEKSIINAKETRIDTRMKNLETEQSAINQMLQGLEQVRNDNIERTFSIFS